MSVPPAVQEREEEWGEMGEAMRSLPPMQRAFVRALLTEKPGKGALTRAAQRAGYGQGAIRENLRKHAHRVSRYPKVIAAINEEAKKYVRGAGHAIAVRALFEILNDTTNKDRMRAVDAILQRVDPVTTLHSVNVTHRTVDPDQEALEELRAARSLGATREKLLELFGGNGLDRLEALERVENAQRAAAAKVIEHE